MSKWVAFLFQVIVVLGRTAKLFASFVLFHIPEVGTL